MNYLEIANLLDAHRGPMTEQVVDTLMSDPFLAERFDVSRTRMLTDVEHNFSALSKAIRYRSPMIMEHHVAWRRAMLVERNCSTGMARQGFAAMWRAVAATLPNEAQSLVGDYFASAMQSLVYPNKNVQQLSEFHELLADGLVEASYDVHWHWQAAYAELGRDRLRYDAWIMVDYMIDALGTSTPEVLGTHLRWLRGFLIERGLSTTHVQQLLWLLSEVAVQRVPPGPASDAKRMLVTAASFLLYEREACRALLAVQDELVATVSEQLTVQGLADQSEQAAVEVGWYLAYLNDCLAAGEPTSLINYTNWMLHWLTHQGLTDAPLRQSYQALEQVMDQYLPPYAAHEACRILQAAQLSI